MNGTHSTSRLGMYRPKSVECTITSPVYKLNSILNTLTIWHN